MTPSLSLSTVARLAILALGAAGGCGGSGTATTTGTGGAGTSSGASTSGASTSSAGPTGTSSGTATGSSSASSSSGSAACPATSTTMLPGVHLEIDGTACTFSLADPATVSIPYHVVVDQDVGGVTPRTQDGGQCGKPGASGLITFEKVAGNAQQYCLCDVGKCPPPSPPPVTLKKGSYPFTFTWDKRNWFGPSDTNTPEGMAFPVGDYTLTVSAIGLQATPNGDMGFVIEATLPVHLVP